jgi:hypothetical protein
MAEKKGEVRFQIKTKGEKETSKKLKHVEKAFDDLASGTKGFNSTLRGMGPRFAAVTAATVAFSVAVAALGRGLNTLAQRGAAFGGPAGVFAQIASPEVLSRMQQLSVWQIRQVDLMRSYNQVMQVGMMQRDQYLEWVQRITTAAQERGDAPAEMFQRFSEALSGGGFENLRTIGVNIAEIQETVQESGRSMESLKGRTQALDLALNQLRQTQGDAEPAIANLADAFGAAATNANDYIDRVARVVSESPALVNSFESVRLTMVAFGDTTQTTGGIIETFFRTIIIGISHVAEQGARITASVMLNNMRIIATIRDNPAFQWIVENIPGGRNLEEMINRLHDLMGGTRSVAGMWETTAQAARVAARETGRIPQPPPGRRQLRAPQPPEEQGEGETALEQAERLAEFYRIGKEGEDEFRRLQAEGHAAEIERIRERSTAQEEYFRKIADQHNSEMERQREQEESIEADRDRRFTKHVSQVNAMTSGFAQIGSTISQIVAQNTENTEKAKKVEGAFLIAYNSVMAATELAEAIRAFAKQRYGSGALHLVAMGNYIAAAALAGSRLGGGQANAPSGTAYRPVERDVDKPTEEKEGGINIYQSYSLSRTEAGLGQVLEEAQYKRTEVGLPYGGIEGIEFGT